MRLLTTIFFIFIIYFCSAQSDPYNRTFSDKIPPSFNIDTEKHCDHVLTKIPSYLRENKYPRSSYRFADLSAVRISYLLKSGKVYTDWESLENYINEIYQKIIPEDLKGDPFVRAHILKDGTSNAFVTPSGMTFINIGLLEAVKDEATLAGILAHELAHYHLNHSIQGFVKSKNGDFKPRLLYKHNNASAFSIKNELQADSLAIVWLAQSGYHISGLKEAFEMNEREEENLLATLKYTWHIESSTHPSSEERLDRINKFYAKNKDKPGAQFLISEQKFHEFKKRVRPEILQLLLNDFNYISCIEKAFKFHILYPEEPKYVYFLMESIRRNAYLDPTFWKKNFITNQYFITKGAGEEKHKVRMKDHLFEEIPTKLLSLRDDEVKAIQANFYWEDAPRFTSNDQAFLFFASIGELYNDPESFFSHALCISHNKEESDLLLKKYLTYDNIQYRDFANNMLENTIKSSLPDKKITVMSDFSIVVKQGREDVWIRDESESGQQFMINLYEKIMETYPERELIILQQICDQQFNDYKMLLELENFSFISLLAFKTKKELHILDPRYWEMLDKLKANEIEFVNCSYYDTRKGIYNLKSYLALINSDFETILSESKRYRYLDVIITSVRAIEDGAMKIRHFGEDIELAYRKPGLDQIIELMQSNIKEKDAYAEAVDILFKALKNN